MNVVLFGATGLIGRGVLLQALDHPGVDRVLTVGRREVELHHPKLRQIVHADFEDFRPIADELRDLDACFWCLGTASWGMDEAAYTRITYDFTMAAAEVLLEQNPALCFCFVSGAGTDESERGRVMWARVKGRTENALARLGFRSLYLFRPAFIQAVRGANPRGPFARALFAVLSPILRAFGGATSNAEIGAAMLAAAQEMATQRVLNSTDINRLAAQASAAA